MAYDRFCSNTDINQLKVDGKQLLEKYSSPQTFDKLSQAQQGVDVVRVEMQQNINKLVANQDDLGNLEEQTRDMRENAGKFEKGSKSLEREMFWRKVKYAAIVVAIILAIVLIIVLSVVLSRK